MKKVAIYACVGTSRSSMQSIEEQVRLWRAHAEREGRSVGGVFPNVDASGAKRDRAGLDARLARVAEFSIILAETPDRIGRDPAHVAATWRRIGSAECRLHAVSGGAICESRAGLARTTAYQSIPASETGGQCPTVT